MSWFCCFPNVCRVVVPLKEAVNRGLNVLFKDIKEVKLGKWESWESFDCDVLWFTTSTHLHSHWAHVANQQMESDGFCSGSLRRAGTASSSLTCIFPDLCFTLRRGSGRAWTPRRVARLLPFLDNSIHSKCWEAKVGERAETLQLGGSHSSVAADARLKQSFGNFWTAVLFTASFDLVPPLLLFYTTHFLLNY